MMSREALTVGITGAQSHGGDDQLSGIAECGIQQTPMPSGVLSDVLKWRPKQTCQRNDRHASGERSEVRLGMEMLQIDRDGMAS
jgi:hypothetical protein